VVRAIDAEEVIVAADDPGPVPMLAVLTDDLVIARRLRQLAEENALTVADPEDLRTSATAPGGAVEQPALAVIDLLRPDALERVRTWRAWWPDAVIAGHLSVPDRELWVAAQRAGCDLVANRGALVPRLRERLARLGTQHARRFPLFEVADAAGRLGLVFRAEETPAGPLAVYRVGSNWHAVADRCPHAGSRLSGGTIEGTTLTCPGHGSRFDICTGERVRGPADTGIATFPLVQDGGVICLLIRG
jgi:nitrite reductase/ring-hydroxylating ferredoxin subunit